MSSRARARGDSKYEDKSFINTKGTFSGKCENFVGVMREPGYPHGEKVSQPAGAGRREARRYPGYSPVFPSVIPPVSTRGSMRIRMRVS